MIMQAVGSFLSRTARGSLSFMGMLLFPLGWWWCRSVKQLATPERLDRGCVFVLPGIQGKSPIEFGVARGLNDAGVNLGIVIFDWTTGFWPFFLFHLRASFWQRAMMQKLTTAIIDYQAAYPDRPVYLIGHSGGAGLSLMTTANLPDSIRIAGVVLLGPAVSPFFDYQSACSKTEFGIWNFYSPFDFFFLGIGTLVAGTMDHWHWPSAGMVRFKTASNATTSQLPQLIQIGYHPSMVRSWNFGGHFGYTNRLFVSDHVAPVLLSALTNKSELRQ